MQERRPPVTMNRWFYPTNNPSLIATCLLNRWFRPTIILLLARLLNVDCYPLR